MADLSFKVSATAQDFTREMEAVKSQTGSVKKQMRSLTQETNNLETAYRRLSNAEKQSPFGKYLRGEIDNNISKLAEMKDTIDDVQGEISKLASDTAIWDGMAEGIGVARDTVSAFATSLGISTKEGGLAANAINTLARAQTIANAAISIGNALQKSSKLMSAITTLQLKAQAAATTLDTAAKGKNTVATVAATAAQKAFNIVASMNPYVLLAMAIVGTTAALFAFASSTDDASDAQDYNNKQMEEARKKHEEYQKALKDTEDELKIELLGTYMALCAEWETLEDEMSKNKFIEDNKEKFKKLGFAIQDVTDANLVMNFYREEVVKTFAAQAQGARDYKIAMDQLKESIDNFNPEDMANFGLGNVRESLNQWAQIQGRVKKTQAEINSHLTPQINKRKGRTGGGGGGGTKTDPKADYTKEVNLLQQQYNAGLIKELDYRKKLVSAEQNYFNALLKSGKATLEDKARLEIRQKEADQLSINTQYQDKLNNLQIEFNHGMITEQEYMQGIADATKELYNENLKLGTATQELADKYKNLADLARPAVESMGKEIENIMSETLHPKIEISETYNFSGLSLYDETAEMSKNADKVIEEMKRIESGRKELEEIMNKPDALDIDIANAQESIEELNERYEELKGQADAYQDLSDAADELSKHNKKVSDSLQSVGDAINACGELFSALGDLSEDEGFNVLGIIAKAVATVALSFAQALTTCKTWVDWLAFGVSGMATMVSMISQIKAATSSGGYAEGGIIGGNSYYGDRILARVNSGEVVLNKRQQKNAWELMNSGLGGAAVQVTGVVRGRDLVLVANNESKYASRGGRNITF